MKLPGHTTGRARRASTERCQENLNAVPGDSEPPVTPARMGKALRWQSKAVLLVFDEDGDTDIVMDFDEGVDAIEFLIESFGYDELDVLTDADALALSRAGETPMLVDVNACGLDANSFQFGSPVRNPDGIVPE